MNYFAIYVLILCVSVMLCRILSNISDVYNKMLAFNNFSTQVVLLITAMSTVLNNSSFLDIALLYASISFISTIALMKLMLTQ